MPLRISSLGLVVLLSLPVVASACGSAGSEGNAEPPAGALPDGEGGATGDAAAVGDGGKGGDAPTDGTADAGLAPTTCTPAPGRPAIVSVVSGGPHACVLYASGRVACWGSDAYGSLGDGV